GFSSRAVVVSEVALVHTTQLLPIGRTGDIDDSTPLEAQVAQVVENLKKVLTAAQSNPARLIRLNLYVAREDLVADIERLLAEALPKSRPAITTVITPLPHPRALL